MPELAYRHPKRGKAHGALVTTRGLLFDPRCHVPRETVAVPVEQIDPADLCKRCWPGRAS